MKKIYITSEERSLISSTPPKECWICNLFSNNVQKDKKGFFFSEKLFSDDGIIEHLKQIIRRQINFK